MEFNEIKEAYMKLKTSAKENFKKALKKTKLTRQDISLVILMDCI